jgi:hypothetical protein
MNELKHSAKGKAQTIAAFETSFPGKLVRHFLNPICFLGGPVSEDLNCRRGQKSIDLSVTLLPLPTSRDFSSLLPIKGSKSCVDA